MLLSLRCELVLHGLVEPPFEHVKQPNALVERIRYP
jgi:hypothetical protein